MFQLSKEFVDGYRSKPVKFGFNGLGELVFYRTYSRKDNPNVEGQESWVDVCERCINGMYTFQQRWCDSNSVNWNPEKAEKSAREAFDLVFDMKWTPPGRGLWMSNTPFVMERGCVEALQNCGFVSTAYIEEERGGVFSWLMEMSMLGVGVGFDTRGAGLIHLTSPSSEFLVYVVPDTRQGWARSVELLINSYFVKGSRTVGFIYDNIRPKGSIISGFGGIASGPDPLIDLHNSIRKILDAQVGEFLDSRTIVDLCNLIGVCVVSGNVRRSAELALGHPNDNEFINLKNYTLNPERMDYGWVSNNSILAERGMDYSDAACRTYENGEPGYFWLDNVKQYGRMDGLRDSRDSEALGTNPCVTGDTWIAVADGRGRARISELALSGNDVDVFTRKDGEIVIRTMRHPRKTGTSSPVLKVNFSDGTHIRVTPNHKFIMLDGSEKQAIDLVNNDALQAMTVYSYKKTGLPKTEKVDYDEAKSYRMVQVGKKRKSEHRLIFKNHAGIEMNGNEYHLHHKDFDGRNNRIDNLEYLSAEDHAALHRDRMIGKNNPASRGMTKEWREKLRVTTVGGRNANANKITNDELKAKMLELIVSLGYRPSCRQYKVFAKANGLPGFFTKYRKDYFGGDITHALGVVATENGFTEYPRYSKVQSKTSDFPVIFRDGETFVVRPCEMCGESFEVEFRRREQSACSPGCGQKLYYKLHGNPKADAIKKGHAKRQDKVREKQASVYNDLVVELGRHPMLKEWKSRCKDLSVSAEINRVTSPFRNYEELTSTALATNHRVLSVEDAGFEDVYTGTVDDTHTFFSIGDERTSMKYSDMGYVLSVNCGEQPLHHHELCCLVEIYLPRCKDKAEFERAIKYAYLYGKSTTLASEQITDPQTRDVMMRNRRIGLSVTGITQFLGTHGKETLRDWLDHGYYISGYYDRLYSQWLGVNESIRRTSVKPSGTVSLVVGVTPGVHYNVAGRFHLRRVVLADDSPLVAILRDSGYPVEPSTYTPGSVAVSFPVDAGIGVRSEDDVTMKEQLDLIALVQRHWADNAVSATVKFDRNKVSVVDIEAALNEYQYKLKGISFLPASDHGYEQAPYESITEATYNDLMSRITPFTLNGLGGKDKLVDAFCDGDACVVPVKG